MEPSRVAVLGTLGEMHFEPIGYDLATLKNIVRDARPDLLLAEIRPDDWASGNPEGIQPEYREALIPLSRRTDIVVVPVAGDRPRGLIRPLGGRFLALRTLLVKMLDAHLRWMQRGRRGLGALNSGLWGAVCDNMCALTARLCGEEVRQQWDAANEALIANVLAAIRRDPGCRVLVTVDCRRRHRLETMLRKESGLELVDHERL